MLNVNDLVEGVTKVRILELPSFVVQNVGDVGTFESNDGDECLQIRVDFGDDYWFFDPEHLEIVGETDETVSKVNSNVPPQSEDLIIYKSRWNQIIEGVNDACNMTEEEEEVVKSVLKNNTPFNIVPDLKVFDPVIEKEYQTHLDANYVGVGSNGCFYYRSDILKQWFWWNEDSKWGKCDFDYGDVNDVLPVSFVIGFGESK